MLFASVIYCINKLFIEDKAPQLPETYIYKSIKLISLRNLNIFNIFIHYENINLNLNASL